MSLDLTKPMQTRDGRKVTIYCTDAPGCWPIHGRIASWSEALSWNDAGRVASTPHSGADLINAPVEEVVTGAMSWAQSWAQTGQYSGCVPVKITLRDGKPVKAEIV